MTLIISETGEYETEAEPGNADDLWLQSDDVPAATGWTWRPEGLCQGDVCVATPPGSAASFVRDDAINVAAYWRHMGGAIAHSEAGDVWVLGETAQNRADPLQRRQAPDFELPDLHGARHQLSDYRGKKVILLSWSSW